MGERDKEEGIHRSEPSRSCSSTANRSRRRMGGGYRWHLDDRDDDDDVDGNHGEEGPGN